MRKDVRNEIRKGERKRKIEESEESMDERKSGRRTKGDCRRKKKWKGRGKKIKNVKKEGGREGRRKKSK